MPSLKNRSFHRLLCLFVALAVCGAVALFAAPAAGVPEGMVLVRGGSFLMGNTLTGGQANEKPVHRVTLNSFYMGRHEVTWGLWKRVYDWATNKGYEFDNPGECGYGNFERDAKMVRKDPDDPDSPLVPNQVVNNHPVTGINWYDAVKWCNARSEIEGRTPVYYTGSLHKTAVRTGLDFSKPAFVKWNANGYRLPTEAEWEYAAKGGNMVVGMDKQPSLYAGGNELDAVAWYRDNSFNQTHPVGLKRANALGLYDMSGNVWEWCYDWYRPYTAAAQVNPRGPDKAQYRVLRGGSFYNSSFLRTAYRYDYFLPGYVAYGDGGGLGFRLVVSAARP